jgi:hypothetical protein
VAWWRKTDPDVERLAEAGTIAFGGVGIASTTLPETEAYFALGKRASGPAAAQLRPALEHLLARATPAGKVYAADLLGQLDPEAGRQAWQRLTTDHAPVSTFTGCVMGRTTLAEYAHGRLGGVRGRDA